MKETKHVRIIDSTFSIYNGKNETESMIGDIYEVKNINYKDKKLSVYSDKEKTDYWFFNFSDVQEVCLEAVVDGYVLGVGDLLCDRPILRFNRYSNYVIAYSGTDEETFSCDLLKTKPIDITPLYKPTATIKIGEKLYNKSEVDKALANLKEIK